jgi:hypothetical protein
MSAGVSSNPTADAARADTGQRDPTGRYFHQEHNVILILVGFALGATAVIAGQRVRTWRLHRRATAEGKLLNLRPLYARQRRDLRARLGR